MPTGMPGSARPPPYGAPAPYGAAPYGGQSVSHDFAAFVCLTWIDNVFLAPSGYPPQGGYGAPPAYGAPAGYGAPRANYGAPPTGAPPGYGAPPPGAPTFPGYGAALPPRTLAPPPGQWMPTPASDPRAVANDAFSR